MTPSSPAEPLAVCQARLGHPFRDPFLLEQALTHASLQGPERSCNERLEFLGDAILGMLAAEFLYHAFPNFEEGELTRVKSVVVSRKVLADLCTESGIAEFVRVGKGVVRKCEPPVSLLANTFEAVVAALYLDGGWEAARQFTVNLLLGEIRKVIQNRHAQNYKSMLQQWAQQELGLTPTYRLVEEQGPDHGKIFVVAAVVGERVFPSCPGGNKKEAEQKAAEAALAMLAGQAPDSPASPALPDLPADLSL